MKTIKFNTILRKKDLTLFPLFFSCLNAHSEHILYGYLMNLLL